MHRLRNIVTNCMIKINYKSLAKYKIMLNKHTQLPASESHCCESCELMLTRSHEVIQTYVLLCIYILLFFLHC